MAEIAEACERWLAKRGFGTEDTVDSEQDDGQALVQAAGGEHAS